MHSLTRNTEGHQDLGFFPVLVAAIVMFVVSLVMVNGVSLLSLAEPRLR